MMPDAADSPALKLYMQGAELFKNGKYEESEDSFRRATEVDPDFYRGWAYLGMAYAQQGKIDPAIEAYRKCIDIEPRYHKALNNVGELYLRKGLLDYAVMVFRMATEVEPTQVQYFYNLGITCAEIGLRPQAEEALATACRLDPADFGAASELSQVRFNLKKYKEALEGLSEFLKTNPDHRRSVELKARIKMLQRKVEEEAPPALPPAQSDPSQSAIRRAPLEETGEPAGE